MMSRVKRPIRHSALVLAAALTLTGCSGLGQQEGVVVNGHGYSVEDVQEAAQQFQALSGQPVAPQAVIGVAGSLPVLDEYFQGTGLGRSDDQLRSDLAGGGLEGEANQLTVDVARYQYYATLLNSPDAASDPALVDVMTKMENYQSDLAEQDVQVNPRFGSWDPASGQVVAEVPSWIQQTGAN